MYMMTWLYMGLVTLMNRLTLIRTETKRGFCSDAEKKESS